MHFENIIASGNHPVPIDIEMILQGSSSEHLSGQKRRASMDLANTKSLNSVMSVGLLPSYLKASDNQMIDIGGLSHRLHQPASNKCININTDEMKFVAKESKIKVSTNLPHKKNKNILFDKHTEIFEKNHDDYNSILLKSIADRLAEALAEHGVSSDTSMGNFVLARFASQAEAQSCDVYLQSQGLIVRSVVGYKLPNYLRITVGDESACRRVAHAVGQFKAGAT